MERHTSFSLPSPTETPYRTPSSSVSHRSTYEDMSPSSTPPPLPSESRLLRKRSSDSQRILDDNLSPLDPRRFTPTLHASLVSEILSLRRDLESKTKSIDLLELSLDAAQTRSDGLSKSLMSANKEIRSVKRQMQILEGGTLSALSDLSKERDDALQESEDLRQRLAHSQRRARSHEESADQTRAQWEIERNIWVTEKRALETKKNIAEGRAKTMLAELTQIQAQIIAQTQDQSKSADGRPRSVSQFSAPGSPVSIASEFRARTHSAVSDSSDHDIGSMQTKFTSHTLADELALDGIEEESAEDADYEHRICPVPLLLGDVKSEPSSPAKNRDVYNCEKTARLEDQGNTVSRRGDEILQKPAYIDSAIQYSPPPSPTHQSAKLIYEEHAIIGKGPVMVSSSCQTVETLPSPPLTPKQNELRLTATSESGSEKAETKDISTQTDPRPRPGASNYIHSRTSTHDLGIPVITIIPPTSRPTTPVSNVVLPPQTKNSSCQVDVKLTFDYTSSSMQTEEIRVDTRNIFSPHLMSGLSKVNPGTHARRGNPRTLSNSSSKRTTQNPPVAPPNDDGPLCDESSIVSARPVRSSSLFAGFDDYVEEDMDEELETDVFYEDDYSSRPTAKFTLRSGKLVSHESNLDDIGEMAAVNAGEAQALDNLKRSESALSPELRQFEEPSQHKRSNPNRRAPSATKPAKNRETGVTSHGPVGLRSRNSQSTFASTSVEGSLPPIPIPLRYSSARVYKSYSESGRTSRDSSNASPTKQYRNKYRPALRKVRSGPAISPSAHNRRPRSKSPPADSRVSIVPEMPTFRMPAPKFQDTQPPLPNETIPSKEASAPRPAVATGPRKYTKQTSDIISPQTSVIDAIAQTMIGEWMYKYVRRRKSFGKPDKDWNPNKSVEELTTNPASAGVRHKRWVWVAPYERAVMWSSKQPMSGTALLGKTGRKLIVKSVLDVKDDNPMPKNSLTGPAFNRSILILTPQRALKFTATNQERHFVWLTALSFLSHSPLSIGDLAALPPPPPDEYSSPVPSLPVESSFRRRTLRDSFRMTRGINKQDSRVKTADGPAPVHYYSNTRPPTQETYDPDKDVAQPPTVRRFHTRGRSNTAPRSMQTSFNSFLQRGVSQSTSQYYVNERIASERAHYTPVVSNASNSHSRNESETSTFGRPSSTNNHTPQTTGFSFTDSSHNASMTMRMDAFIDTKQTGKGGFRKLRLGGASRPTNKDLSYWGLDEMPSMLVSEDNSTAANNSTG